MSRDPLVASTMSPYAYVSGNPLNATDPSGMCWGPQAVCDAIDAAARAAAAAAAAALRAARTPSNLNPLYLTTNVVAEVSYGAYYASYRTLSTIGSVPFVGRAITEMPGVSGLYGIEYVGLKGDEGIDAFKRNFFHNGELNGDEGQNIYLTPIHAGPQVYGPGEHSNGGEDLYPGSSYPWQAGFGRPACVG